MNAELLTRIEECYSSLADFRNMRDRAKRYAYGRQWSDMICNNGTWMSEEDYIRSQGSVPLKNNLIRKLVRSVLGVFRNSYAFPTADTLGLDPDDSRDAARYERLRKMADANRLEELYARTMEEFLISGMAVHRITPDVPIPTLPDTAPFGTLRTDYVAPDTFFFDGGAHDFRGWDVNFVGEIHDVDFATLCAAFAKSPEDVKRLAGIYRFAAAARLGSHEAACRVYEVWHLDCLQRYRVHNREKGIVYKMEAADYERLPAKERKRLDAQWMSDKVWRYSFLAPTGEVIEEGDSPLRDGGHPYVWRAYPFIDGEIHSFVDDVIDQQRFTNRLITLYDWVLRSTAKGVLLFPQEAVPPGADMDVITDEWSKFNGVILYQSKVTDKVPQQVSAVTSQSGITELLNIQLKMFEDISGVNSALQGRLESGSTSGTLYDSQMRQALVSLRDLLDSYSSFIREATLRTLSLLA